jgi:hypothetical protein
MAEKPKLVLRRATPKNGLFKVMKDEWDQQLKTDEDSPAEYYEPMMAHAEKIAGEHPQDPRYGIFVLVEQDVNDGHVSCHGMVHINHAWPKSKDATLRLVWNLIAPRYQYGEPNSAALARIMVGFIVESLALCGNDMPSKELKIYLGNAIDREYAAIAASILEVTQPDFGFKIHGAWLHIRVAS